MSNKYISQINNTNFVYPNYDLAEYDVEIVHNINNYSVSGYVTSFSAVTVSSSNITINYNMTWIKNNAEIFLRQNGNINFISIHGIAASKIYYKPFLVVSSISSPNTGQTTQTFNGSFSMAPVQFGLSSFVTGPYYFEIRFIGGNSIYPICQTLNLTI